MSHLFLKLPHKLNFNLNLDSILASMDQDIININNPHRAHVDTSYGTYWQLFPTNIRFSRNFVRDFPNESNHIVDQIIKLQDETKKLYEHKNENNWMVNSFINHTVSLGRIGLIKINAGISVPPHRDRTRHLTLSIGLKNSNTCETHFSRHNDVREFWKSGTDHFTLEDNTAYLTQVTKNHAVKSLVSQESNLERLILSYTILRPAERNGSNYGDG